MPGVTRRARIATEGVLVAVLLQLALWYGNFAADHAINPPDYHYLSPAIAVAAGKGFHGAVPVPGSPLDDFLSRRSMTLAWSEAERMTVGPPDRFHETTRYLINTVGYWWRIVGISWHSIGAVGAAFHGMTVAGTYALIRAFLPVPFAAIGALWMCTSTLQLALVPHVRDYSKGAFIIAVLPLLAVLALRPLSRRMLLLCAGGAGALIGFGQGFKMDVAIMLPLAIACIVLLRGQRPWTDLREKGLLLLALMAGWLLGAGPLLYRLSEGGSNSFHVVLLGFSGGFDANLGIDRSVYAYLPFYSDAYVANVIQGHSGAVQWLGFPSPEYDEAGRALFLDLVRSFPADMWARALAAANAVMNLCFLSRDPSFLTQRLPMQDALVWVYTALHRFNGWGGALALLFVAVAAWGHWRRGVFAALTLLVLAGYPALQFESRHYFHAQIVPVVAILTVAYGLARMLAGLVAARMTVGVADALPSLLVTALLLPMIGVPLAALRTLQSARVERAVAAYLDRRVPLQTNVVAEASGSALVSWRQPPGPPIAGGLQAAHYVVEFQDDGRGAPITMSARFDDTTPAADYSRVFTVRPAAGPNYIGFTAFAIDGQSAFAGIELGPSALARMTGVYRVDSGGPSGLPLDVRLPADWRQRPLYQRLHIEPANPRAMPDTPVICANNAGCKHSIAYVDRLPDARLAVSERSMGMIHSPIVTVGAGEVVVDGDAESESSYLFQMQERAVASPAAFVAAGELHEGGITIGLLKQGAWYRQAVVSKPGPFIVVVPVDDAGTYVPLFTNAMPPGQRRARFSVSAAGFMDAPARPVQP